METQLFYIGTSKLKEIRAGGGATYEWGSYGSWTKFKSPKASKKKKVAYKKSTKNKAGTRTGPFAGGVTKLGTTIPATVTKTIGGVERKVAVRYYQRGYTIYTRTSALKKLKKMLQTIYDKTHPYQYRLQYQDKQVQTKEYSKYVDGMEYIFFGKIYYDDSGEVATSGHLPHPTTCEMSYSDVRRNFESNANNSDSRDNSGSYILSNVRANVVTLTLGWTGLTADQGAELLDTLNPSKDSKGSYNYLVVQYLDYATGAHKNGTFFAEARTASKYPNGTFREITVTLTEV